MKYIITFILLSLLCIAARSQNNSFVVRSGASGDTLFAYNPSTGTWTQLTKWIPDMTGQSGKILSTNGSNYNWITPTTYLASNGNGSGLTNMTASQVGLGNVDNSSDATKNAASVVLTNKTLGSFNYAVDAQGSDSYVITLSPAPVSYTTGMMIIFKANTANTTGCTININNLGIKTIVKRVNTTPATGDILAAMLCWIVYDGTNFVLLNPIVN